MTAKNTIRFKFTQYFPQDSPTKQIIKIQSTRSSKLRAKSAKQRLHHQQQFEDLHIGPLY